MQIHPSARKHGILDENIRHAFENALSSDEMDDLTLIIGPACDTALLELLAVERAERESLVIHAMPLRRKYLPLLGLGDE